MRGRWVGGLLLLGSLVGACSLVSDSGGSDPPLAWDFFGVVERVESDAVVASDSLVVGGPDSEYRSPAMRVEFLNGDAIDVPAGTPGGNACFELSGQGRSDRPCVLAGVLDEANQVVWFEIVSVERTPQRRGGGWHAGVFPIERLDGDALIVRGVRLPLRADATLEICLEDDATTIPEAVAADVGLIADVSTNDGAVYNVWCVYNF